METKTKNLLSPDQFEEVVQFMRDTPGYRLRETSIPIARHMLVHSVPKVDLVTSTGKGRTTLYRIERRFRDAHRQLTAPDAPRPVNVTVRVPLGTKAQVERFAEHLWDTAAAP